MKKLISITIMAGMMLSALGVQPWQNRELSENQRIDALVDELTLEEKLDLISMGGVQRLGIRPHGGLEAIHGLVFGGPARDAGTPFVTTTAFPQGYGLGETWDAELLQKIGHQMGVEARAIYQDTTYHVFCGLVLWTPNADIGRDPRWGRTEECYGEDPTLVGQLSASMIQGMQGDDPDYWLAASLMKHFLANSNECDRTSSSSNMSDKLWREYYSYGFLKGFEAGGSSYMAAYNKLNGVPCTVHPMLRDIVAQQWGVDGIVTTDGGAFKQLVTHHHYFDNEADAFAACIKNGVNMYLDRYRPAADTAIASGLVSEAEIDSAIGGRIRVMLKLGLLDAPDERANPYLSITGEPWNTPEARALARRAAQESIVLLKNDGEHPLLPINSKEINKIAVVGNRADSVWADWYGGTPPYRVSPLQGIKNIADVEGIEVRYVPFDKAGSATDAAEWADIVIAVVGNHPTTSTDYERTPPWGYGATKGDGREEVDRQSLQLDTEDMIRLLYKHNPNVVVVLISSFPFAINWTQEHIPAIVHCTHSGQELGNALADVLFGAYNPGGRLTQTWPKAIDDLPDMMDYDITHGRTYMYSEVEPLYPFGYGLSYTAFDYSNLKVKKKDHEIIVSVDITNSGDRDGDEVAQVYVVTPGDTAKQRLRAFDRVNIAAGATKTVTTEIPVDELRLWDDGQWNLHKGKYTINVASSSDSPLLTTCITL